MGDIADMMLDGTLCECCGEYIGDGGGIPGIPGYCSEACANDRGMTLKDHGVPTQRRRAAPARKAACPTCGKKVKATGLQDHQRDKHGWRRGDP